MYCSYLFKAHKVRMVLADELYISGVVCCCSKATYMQTVTMIVFKRVSIFQTFVRVVLVTVKVDLMVRQILKIIKKSGRIIRLCN